MQVAFDIGTINIQNKEVVKFIQNKSIEEVKALFLNFLSKEVASPAPKFSYTKKDPKKHSRIIERGYNVEDVDEFALMHIEDSGKYIHDLRREKR